MSWIICLNVQHRRRRTARPNAGRNVRPAIEHCNVIGLTLGLSNNESRWVFGPPSLLLACTCLDLQTSTRSRFSAGSFGCPTTLCCAELRPVCGTSMANPLVWPYLPLDRHTGCSNRSRANQGSSGRCFGSPTLPP